MTFPKENPLVNIPDDVLAQLKRGITHRQIDSGMLCLREHEHLLERLDPTQKPLIIAFGSRELPALVHDALQLHAKRDAAGAPGSLLPIEDADHFSIISELQKPDGALVKAAIDLLCLS